MYDVTRTFFEGQAHFDLAQRGDSRDQRSDCQQVCIGLVVSRCGRPLGDEVFAGNTADVTTVKHLVTTMQKRDGKSDRVWVMDRGMVSEANLAFLREGGRRDIVSASPADTPETFLLCRSRDRSPPEEAIVQRGEQTIETRGKSRVARREKQKRQPLKIEREVGRLLGQNTRAAKLWEVTVETTEDGHARRKWTKGEALRDWSRLRAGGDLLRTNVRVRDVILPTRDGIDIRKRGLRTPSEHQPILLESLKLTLPDKLNKTEMS